MKSAHIRVSEYFTRRRCISHFAEIFHFPEGQISLKKARFRVLFSGWGGRILNRVLRESVQKSFVLCRKTYPFRLRRNGAVLHGKSQRKKPERYFVPSGLFWLGWPDSDRRMRESKSRALPLGDTPTLPLIIPYPPLECQYFFSPSGILAENSFRRAGLSLFRRNSRRFFVGFSGCFAASRAYLSLR